MHTYINSRQARSESVSELKEPHLHSICAAPVNMLRHDARRGRDQNNLSRPARTEIARPRHRRRQRSGLRLPSSMNASLPMTMLVNAATDILGPAATFSPSGLMQNFRYHETIDLTTSPVSPYFVQNTTTERDTDAVYPTLAINISGPLVSRNPSSVASSSYVDLTSPTVAESRHTTSFSSHNWSKCQAYHSALPAAYG